MLRRANEIIVQTKWMKDGCIALADISPEKIIINQPNVMLDENISYIGGNKPLFIYPASGHIYKNHRVILEAAIILAERGIYEYEISFTLTGNETRNISAISQYVKRKNLPIRFIGSIPYHELQKYYCSSMLVFPSYIESFGLPLLEARLAGTPVVAADTPFAQEILDGYFKATFFPYDQGHDLADIIQKFIISYKGN
jgi:glycosyltransferase involved in cell wall biosynthesis